VNSFVQRHESKVIGMLSGFDRLLFRGTLRRLATADGLLGCLWALQVLLKDFGDWSAGLTGRVRDASERVMREAGRPIVYVSDPSARKEDLARAIARRDGIDSGPVALLTAVEPCWSYDIHRDRREKKLRLVSRPRKCLHLYHYRIDPELGFMHARLQTWLPFTLRVCVNGREWLARQMDRAGIGYVRRDNCFTAVSDVAGAQALLDGQLRSDWPGLLEAVRAAAHPAHEALWGPSSAVPVDYYWSADQSEWATDVMFKDRRSLAELYPRLIGQGMRTLGSPDVMRFLGHRVPASGGVNGHFQGEVVSDLKDRPEGVRIKHRVNGNSLKMYDKQGTVLRVETTINDPRQFKVYRGTEAEPDNKDWRKLRKGVADLHRRAQVSQACNERYLDAMAAVEQTASLGQALRPLCRPVTRDGGRARALRPFDPADMKLLETVARGEFAINGFRNRDVRHLLLGPDGPAADPKALRRRSGQVTRKLRLLRAHGLIRKVQKTHRYLLTAKGRQVITLLLAARDAGASRLTAAA